MLTLAEVDRYYNLALIEVTAAHAGQTRADKATPYVVHPVDVARRMRRRVEELSDAVAGTLARGYLFLDRNELLLVALLAALGHDVGEDAKDFPLYDRWLATGIPPAYVGEARLTIDLLTNSSGDYLDYLLRLKANGKWLPMTLKCEDMHSNWASLDKIPSAGRRKALKTKISLAHWVLFGAKLDEAKAAL